MQNERDPLQDWINQWWPVAPMYSQGELDTSVSHAIQEERARMVQVLEHFFERLEYHKYDLGERGEVVQLEHIKICFSDAIHRLTNPS